MHYAIIAAGEGSRLRQEGVTLPKPLVRLNGQPMIKRLIDIFMECNPSSLSVIVNEQMTEVRDFLNSLSLPVPFHMVVKSTPSSMHSFWEVSRVLPADGKFILTTVDTIFRRDDFLAYARAFEADPSAQAFMTVTPFIDDEKPLYVSVDDDMRITGFHDEPFPGVRYISGGVYGLTPPCLDVLRECIETGVSRMRNYQRRLVSDGLRVKAFPISKIVDVDHQADIATAEEFINS